MATEHMIDGDGAFDGRRWGTSRMDFNTCMLSVLQACVHAVASSTFETSSSICLELSKVRRDDVRTGTLDAEAG